MVMVVVKTWVWQQVISMALMVGDGGGGGLLIKHLLVVETWTWWLMLML